jgi:hypothetical protein
LVGIFLLPLLSDFFAVITIKNFQMRLMSVFLALVPVIILLPALVIYTFVVSLFIYKNKSQFFENVSYTFDQRGIIKHVESQGVLRPWREISKFRETKSFFLVYISRMDFHLIQKSKFNGSEELANFRTMLKRNVRG